VTPSAPAPEHRRAAPPSADPGRSGIAFDAALTLHRYLVATHWTGDALIGPDPGIRLNYRIGRFIKGYLDRLPWNDAVYFLQAQGYWILANWALFTTTQDEQHRAIALRCSERVLSGQRADGAWNYPLRAWAERTATVEGIWASLGLIETWRQTGERAFLSGAVRWHRFLAEHIGYVRVGDGLAVNYFAGYCDQAVPNNSTDALRFLAEMAEATHDDSYLEPCAGLIRFLRAAQTPGGEFPYVFKKDEHSEGRPHFQCYQYNAFQCFGLMSYYEITGDGTVLPIIARLLTFLHQGLGADGHAHYMCGDASRTVSYHTAVLGAVFARAAGIGIPGYDDAAGRALRYVVDLQEPSGRLRHSQRDYRLLSDRRSYPRYLAMILYHLLIQHLRGERWSSSRSRLSAPACAAAER
jgi:hypothetical protein